MSKIPDVECRTVELEVRLDKEDDRPTLKGYAAVYNKRAEIYPGLSEQIKPGAFDGVLKSDDTRALFNHDSNFPLGRKSAGTLELRSDKKGLAYKIFLPDTQIGRDLPINIERGDVTGSSFSFTVEKDEWVENKDGTIERSIIKLRSLGDVGPVTFPAYQDTTVAARSLDAFRAELEPDEAFQQEALDGEAQEEIEIESDAREREMEMVGRG